MKKKLKKLLKAAKRIKQFIVQTIKNYKSMKEAIKKIMAITIFTVMLVSCGSTKVSVEKPAQGTQTTITVTTNNPITTEVQPNTEFLNK